MPSDPSLLVSLAVTKVAAINKWAELFPIRVCKNVHAILFSKLQSINFLSLQTDSVEQVAGGWQHALQKMSTKRCST